jgi:hypothetical protein
LAERTLRRIGRHEKNGCRRRGELSAGVAALHLTLCGLRGTVAGVGTPADFPMRDFFTSLKRSSVGAALGVILGLLAPGLLGLGQSAQAANPAELNFWLSGPRYDGRVKACEAALSTITYQFREKESSFWNSSLMITGYGRIHETAFRPWQSDNIPRRYCSADVMLNDGKMRQVHYSLIEDGGFAGFGQGVEWCVTGLDRNWAYNPGCKAARP